VTNIILGDNMNTYKTKTNPLLLRNRRRNVRNNHLTLNDMIGRYKAWEPINSVELKHKLK